MNEFSNFIETLNIPNRDLVIMGDFNIHVDDPDDSNGTQFCNLLNDLSMQNHVKVPTYKRSNHTLDLVIDSYTHSYLEPIVSDVKVCLTSSFSDHGFVSYSINCRPFFVKVDTTIQFRKYNDVEIFRDETRNLLDTLETTESLELTTLFNQALTTKRDEFFPLLSKTITLCAASPWYNGSCKRSKTSCRRFERRYRKRPSVTSRESYLLALNELNATLLAAKTEYYKRVFEDLRNNPRKLYATVAIIKGKSPNSLLPDLARTNPLELATKFNNYLLEKILSIRSYLDTLPMSTIQFNPPDLVSNLTEFRRITVDEFEVIYKNVNVTNCPLDPVDFRRISPDFLKADFLNIVNTTFSTSDFPKSERRGIVYPSLKALDLDFNALASYRPITNVTYVSKLVETAIYDQLYDHVTANDLLPNTQSAYRKHHSTESALTRMYSDVITNMDNNLHTILISLDLSSAFDSIDHGLLLQELYSIGIRDDALRTIESYLTERTVTVSINDTLSEPLPLRFGVPQGSVLGPLLFSLYTRRLSTLLNDLGLQHHIYADDTQLYCSFDDDQVDSTKERLITALQSIKGWMTGMKLKLNFSKTNAVIFSPKHKRESMKTRFGSLQLDGATIQPTTEVKILGVIFDSALSFGPQIDSVVRSCNFALHNLQVAREYLPHDLLVASVTQDVLSRIDYCNALYLNLPKYQLYRLQKLINRAARLVHKLPRRAHVTPSLKKLHWLPIGPRIDFKLILLTHKTLLSQKPEYLLDLLPISRNHLLRQPSSLGGHMISNRSFRYSAPRLYNLIPSEIKQHATETFKRHLKAFLFSDAFDHKLESLLHYTPSTEFVMSRRA